MPYAEAIIFENAAINLCPPGGVKVLKQLGHLLNQDPTPFVPEMEKNAKPKMLAIIREDECIGCTKCIQACPVDAILGSAKQMHTIIADECTGCELCIAPCPVDCIDVEMLANPPSENAQNYKASIARKRYADRLNRLDKEQLEKKKNINAISLRKKQNYISAAIARAKEKK